MRHDENDAARLHAVSDLAEELSRLQQMVEDVDHDRGRYAPSRHVRGTKYAGVDGMAHSAKIVRQLLVHVPVRLVEPEVIECAEFRERRREQTGIGADLQEVPGHPTVPAQKADVVFLRALARLQWQIEHVLGLAAVKSVELALPIIAPAEHGAAIRALEIGEENPRLRVAGNKIGVLLGVQRFCRGRGRNARLGVCCRYAAAGTSSDIVIVGTQIVRVFAEASRIRRRPSALQFDFFKVVHSVQGYAP